MSQHTCVVWLLTFSLFEGKLPKELGQLTNLIYFDVSNNAQYEKDEDGERDHDRPIPGTGFTGESCMPQHTCAVGLLTLSLFGRGTAQGARQSRQLDLA